MALNVGINGFGRIGRIIFRASLLNPGLKVSAINDPAVDIDYICYLIKFDSTHGKFRGTVVRSENEITIDGHKIVIFKEKLPANIPWYLANVQYVVEASGMFTSLEKASGHLASEGVKRVLVTAPSLDVPMIVLGVNDGHLSEGQKVISCASSTLYCLAPIIKILEDHFGVSEGFITSIHAMTPSLKPLDGLCLKGKHWRDHRSIHQNIIPATTGACRALGKIIPQVKDRMTGLAFRVPIVNVSVLDITIRLKSDTTMEGIRRLVENAGNFNMQNIIRVSKEQAVSSDFMGDTFSCILDLDSSLQLTPDFFKLICWYENEHSYACRIIDSIFFLERQYQLEWNSKMSFIRSTPKQNLEQPEARNKLTYHQACSYEYHSNSKSLFSTSQDSGFKSPKRPLITRKSVSPRSFTSRQMLNARDSKKKNETFKIWKDEDETLNIPQRHNKSSFFRSCVAITPQLNGSTYVKTREHLENVKQEFSKMVVMTENLLKKSHHSKLEIGVTEVSTTSSVSNANVENLKLDIEAKFSLDKNIDYNVIDNNNIKNKDNMEENNASKSFEEQNRNKSNTLVTRKQLINKDDDNLWNSAINDDKRTYSFEAFKTISFCRFPTSTQPEEDDDTKCIIDKNHSENLNELHRNSNTNITDKVINADNNSFVQLLISRCFHKKKNDAQDISVNIPPLENHTQACFIENDNNSQSKCLIEQKKVSVIKQIESSKSATVGVNNKKSSEKADTNICETGTIDQQYNLGRDLKLRLEGVLKKLAIDSKAVSEKPSTCLSSINTVTTVSNRDVKQKQDIYDKLDSVSVTDSENSFHMKERKSQVINITDLTNSLEDLERLDKICRIMEISDELSDQLLSALNDNECKDLKNKKWSFKDLCEKIKLDDFCNKIFNTSSS